ncbi:MAG: hypothetical protein QG602_2406 [Verrucomicrobiota bacterium]|nr:hypothetical protein [Verrucomicrobiota bacterium]
MSTDQKPDPASFVILKRRITVSLPEHIGMAIDQRARPMSATPTEYATNIIRWWYGQGCPALSEEEKFLQEVSEEVGEAIRYKKKPAKKDGK